MRSQRDLVEDKCREAHITPRQYEILTLIRDGLEYQQIAHRLFITPGTVKNHVHALAQNLGVCNRVAAVVKAYEIGLFTTTPHDEAPKDEHVDQIARMVHRGVMHGVPAWSDLNDSIRNKYRSIALSVCELRDAQLRWIR